MTCDIILGIAVGLRQHDGIVTVGGVLGIHARAQTHGKAAVLSVNERLGRIILVKLLLICREFLGRELARKVGGRNHRRAGQLKTEAAECGDAGCNGMGDEDTLRAVDRGIRADIAVACIAVGVTDPVLRLYAGHCHLQRFGICGGNAAFGQMEVQLCRGRLDGMGDRLAVDLHQIHAQGHIALLGTSADFSNAARQIARNRSLKIVPPEVVLADDIMHGGRCAVNGTADIAVADRETVAVIKRAVIAGICLTCHFRMTCRADTHA